MIENIPDEVAKIPYALEVIRVGFPAAIAVATESTDAVWLTLALNLDFVVLAVWRFFALRLVVVCACTTLAKTPKKITNNKHLK